jgi:hypothetical protein
VCYQLTFAGENDTRFVLSLAHFLVSGNAVSLGPRRGLSVESFDTEMSVSNMLIGSIGEGATRDEKWVIPMIMPRNFANRHPCKGFVKNPQS